MSSKIFLTTFFVIILLFFIIQHENSDNNKILGHTLSPEVSSFISEQNEFINKKIVYKNVKEHPIESYRVYNGVHQSDNNTVLIWINPSGPHVDYTIAHELMHEVVQIEGFPRSDPRDESAAFYCSILTSSIQDPVVDYRLFNNNISYNISNQFQQVIELLEQGNYNNDANKWALFYLKVEVYPALDYRIKEELKSKIWYFIPQAGSLGDKLVENVNKTGFKTRDFLIFSGNP